MIAADGTAGMTPGERRDARHQLLLSRSDLLTSVGTAVGVLKGFSQALARLHRPNAVGAAAAVASWRSIASTRRATMGRAARWRWRGTPPARRASSIPLEALAG